MIGFISIEQKSVKPYFDFLKMQALHGNKSPHSDGWGMAFYREDEFFMNKSAKPIWKNEEIIDEMANSAIFHARKASFGKANVLFSHPFIFEKDGKIWSFAHNGTIYNLSDHKEKYDIDTQFYVKKFITNLKYGDPVKSIEITIKDLMDLSKNEFTSLNSIIVNDDTLLAIKFVKKHDDEYHTLFYRADKNMLSVSTESSQDEWIPLQNGEYIFAKKTENSIDFEIGKL